MDERNLSGFEEYLLLKERSENTIECYRAGVKRYFEMFDEVTDANLLKFKRLLMARHKPSTVNNYLNGMAAYAAYMGAKITRPNRVKTQKALSIENVITPEEFDKLVAALKADGNERGYWLVMFLAKTGARVSEFVRLTKKGLEQGYEEMWTKGKMRRIYIPSELIEASRAWFSSVPSNALFPSMCQDKRYRGKPVSIRRVGLILQEFANRYGVRKEVMHPHGFRHFFAKEFLRAGGDLETLSGLLGHESLNTTSIYTRRSSEELAAELSRRTIWNSELPNAAPDARSITILFQFEVKDSAVIALLQKVTQLEEALRVLIGGKGRVTWS